VRFCDNQAPTFEGLQHGRVQQERLPTPASGEGRPLASHHVMPFVEGETLRDRLNRDKQLPVAEAGEGYSEGDTCEALVGMHRLALATRDRRGQERAGRSLPPRGGKGRPRPYCFNTPKFTCVLL